MTLATLRFVIPQIYNTYWNKILIERKSQFNLLHVKRELISFLPLLTHHKNRITVSQLHDSLRPGTDALFVELYV